MINSDYCQAKVVDWSRRIEMDATSNLMAHEYHLYCIEQHDGIEWGRNQCGLFGLAGFFSLTQQLSRTPCCTTPTVTRGYSNQGAL